MDITSVLQTIGELMYHPTNREVKSACDIDFALDPMYLIFHPSLR